LLSASFSLLQSVGVADTVTPLFPTGRNRLIGGDCLEIMRALPAGSFDVLYLDPPFFSNKDYHLHNGDRGSVYSFSDIWSEGLPEYLQWLEARLVEMRRLLQPEGALFVHLDWHAVHYVKVILDRVFGYENFQNELIWFYSGGGTSRSHFARKHDNILYYTKSAKSWKFYADRVRESYKWTDGQKRADGSARDLERGKLPDDVWQHHALMPWASESLGYPTQKPEELLRRLLLATSDEGDVVGDFFCGGGTTAAVAQQLGRRWVTADISRVAICLTAERIAEQLAPGCIVRTAQRSRAFAKERFDRILADESQLGLSQAAQENFTPLLDLGAGFTVERLLEPDITDGFSEEG
jgi:DNA modification methylase